MISRHWKGVVKSGREEEYVRYLRTETFPRLARNAGFLRATILRRHAGEGTEFQIVTLWKSLDAIQAFAGGDAEAAVVPPAAQELLLRYDSRAVHYEVAETFDAPV
jgi:heme-degrading monooxygenase HmoA